MSRCRILWLAGFFLLAANLIVSASCKEGTFVLQLGSFRFPAQTPYKPLLLLNGAFVTYLIWSCRVAQRRGKALSGEHMLKAFGLPFTFWLAVVIAVAYLPTLAVNISHHDWTHRHISASLTSWHSVLRLFVVPQPDGMYRPLGFFSFWLDYTLFGSALWGYHLQSIGLHIINSVLVGLLALRLGFQPNVSRIAAFLFGIASAHFEAVLWPAARFDLLAATFGTLSLLLFLRYWTFPASTNYYAVLSIFSFVVAVLFKETAYSLVLIVPGLITTHQTWGLHRLSTRRAIGVLTALFSCAAALIAVRLVLFGSFGGYDYSTGQHAPATMALKPAYLLMVNAVSLSIFGINCTVQSLAGKAIALAHACAVLLFAYLYFGERNLKGGVLVGFTILSAIPAVSVIGWIQPSLQHSRHLYWPTVWIALLLAFGLQRASAPVLLTGIFGAVQLAGLGYNIWVYRDMLDRANLSVERVKRDAAAVEACRTEVHLLGIPDSPNGVFYLGPELQGRLQIAIPKARIRLCGANDACDAGPDRLILRYHWDNRSRTLFSVATSPTGP